MQREGVSQVSRTLSSRAFTSRGHLRAAVAKHFKYAVGGGRFAPERARTQICTVAAWVGLALLWASLAAPSAASAAATRNFDTQISGLTPPSAPVQGPFRSPYGVAIGPADNAWVLDEGTSALSELNPSGGYLSQITGAGSRRLAINRSTGEIYTVAGDGPNAIGVYASNGALLRQISFGYSGCGEIAIAVDNSGGAGGPGEGEQGRLYVTYNCSVRGVQALDPNGNPVNFSASAGYIFGNEITGTPAGEFERPGRVVATNSHGDFYIFGRVTGEENGAVYEFAPSGSLIGTISGAEIPGGFGDIESIAVDPTNGNLLFAGYNGESTIFEFSEAGKFLEKFTGISAGSPFRAITGIAVSSSGYLYAADPYAGVVDVFLPLGLGPLPEATTETATEIERNTATLHARAALGGGSNITKCRFEYSIAADYKPWAEPEPYAATAPCLNSADETVGTTGKPIEGTTALHAPIAGLHAGDTFHFRISLSNGDEVPRNGSDESLETPPAVTGVKTLSATEITNKSTLLHGSYTGEDIPTTYRFEYTTEADFEDHGYGTAFKVPIPNAEAPEGSGEVLVPPLEASGLVPNTAYVYRLVATNKFGTSFSENQPFTTFQPPTIEGFFTSHVTATSADLEAKINPEGFTTECHFEYGRTTSYGSSVLCPEPLTGDEGIQVVVPIAELETGATYHFRVITQSKWGVVTSEDQTFEFFPRKCPNAAIRNQTGTAYLPDCRAYELVSPPNANGTLLYAGGPNTGQATNPPRFSFTGVFGALPGANPVNSVGDLYVATRSDSGWSSRYVGLPGNEAGCVGGPPNYPLSHIVYPNPPYITNSVPANPAMERFLIWNDGTPVACFDGTSPFSDTNWAQDSPSNAPYMYNAEGTLIRRLPTDFPGESNDLESALKCPYATQDTVTPPCTSEVTASEDLSHFVFSSNTTSFAPGGLAKVPGSAYDNNLATGTLQLISLTASGKNIPQDPVFAKTPPQTYSGIIEVAGGEEEFLRFPAVSSDGSHILISTATEGTTVCRNGGEIRFGLCPRFTATPVHLYMRVGDAVTYEIAEGKPVTYVGMTPDGSKVFFTSEEHLTSEDPGHVGASLYMWSQKGEEEHHPLTLISKGESEEPGASGNTGDCHPALRSGVRWTTSCSAVPISTYFYSFLTGGAGGNGFSDSAISANGDIYFYSPEQLEGTKGIPGLANIYDYREGKARYVTTLKPEEKCTKTGVLGVDTVCTPEAVLRINVNPNDTHMAFVTGSRLSAYENAGHLEMYSYTPASGALVCDSCNPDGQPASADVHASQDGLFMTNDGRTFFATNESLVPQDTNEGPDVYEFVEGRPQLITPGTGTASIGGAAFSFTAANELPGLVGVSASGTDVYFDTFDGLISGDRNGNFFRFYDARINGGFASPPPAQPCAAAEECHGQGNEPPELPTQGTAARLAGGNVTPGQPAKRLKRHKRKARRGHRRVRHEKRRRAR